MQVNASQTYSIIGILSVFQIVFILVDVSFASVVVFFRSVNLLVKQKTTERDSWCIQSFSSLILP